MFTKKRSYRRLGKLVREVLEEKNSGLIVGGFGPSQAIDGSFRGRLSQLHGPSHYYRLTPADCQNESEIKAQFAAELERIRREIQKADTQAI